MSKVKTIGTYRKAKWVCFAASVLSYFLPFIIVTACLLPLTRQTSGTAFAVGMAIVALNALPFIGGVFHSVLAHFPMVNVLSVVFLMLYVFFTIKLFQDYVSVFCWIEFSAAVGSVVSCVLWHFYRKNARRLETAKTNKDMGLI